MTTWANRSAYPQVAATQHHRLPKLIVLKLRIRGPAIHADYGSRRQGGSRATAFEARESGCLTTAWSRLC